ncbi:MAG: Uma2 family endonuclease [Syntrophobacteraceae bacterium]|jgi:Uma2 family endonuclease
MSEPAKKKATYDDLFSIPDNMTGEIIAGELIVTPRPSRKHGYVAYSLGGRLTPSYQFGEGGGPGGWIFIAEPEIGFGEDILVPDVAAWKRARFPVDEGHNWISVSPAWICEVLSPRTARMDKTGKMPVYARSGVQHLWLIDPLARTLDAFRLEEGKWVVIGLFVQNDRVRVEPFQETLLDLSDLWLEGTPQAAE